LNGCSDIAASEGDRAEREPGHRQSETAAGKSLHANGGCPYNHLTSTTAPLLPNARPAMTTTSVSLLQRLRQPGQPGAWARFVALYTPLLLRWARGLGLPTQDASDLVQEVFTVLVQKLPDFNYDSHKTFRGWLRTVAVNKWRDGQRRKRLPLEPGAPPLDELPAPEDSDAFADGEFRRHLMRRALEVMRAEFKPVAWKACWETIVQGRSGAEVARELGTTENAVYVSKYKVLRRLRQELEGFLDEE
jgi:RNA polymerase sigma-70 factor (ECF subfamily)